MGFHSYMVNSSGIPIELVKRILAQCEVKYFVETGTAGGDSLRSVANLFQECHSSEIIQGRYDALITQEWPEHVHLHHRDSVDFLKCIVSSFDGHVLFWLDAHYSDHEPSPEGTIECPLLDEIKAISVHSNSIILIDDARLFLGPHQWPNDPNQWPTIQEIFAQIREWLPHHYTTIIDDYIVSVPWSLKSILDTEWSENYSKRYPSTPDRIRAHVKELYEYLIKYIQ